MQLEEEFGPFDEVSAGSNWLNAGAVDYIWRDEGAPPTLPQIVVVRRTVTVDADRIRVKEEEVIGRHVGTDEIARWVAAGAPLSPSAVSVRTDAPRS
jgi:hypothetical protein